MSLTGAINRFRRREADLRVEAGTTGIVRRPSGTAINSSTLVATPIAATVYSGPVVVRPANREGQTEVVGDDPSVAISYIAKFPVDTAVRKNDVLVIDASLDAGLIGRSFRLHDIPGDAWEIARRCALEEIAS